MMNTPEQIPGTQAVRRAIALLRQFSDEQPHWSLPQLAAAMNFSQSTTYRLVQALEQAGLLTRGRVARLRPSGMPATGSRGEENAPYQLGPELARLGEMAQHSNPLYRVAAPELAELAAAVGETVTLEVRVGAEMLIVEEVVGDRLMAGIQSVGTAWAAHATSTGLAILAHQPGALAELLTAFGLPPDSLTAELPAFTPHTLTTVTALRQELARVRQRGYAIADGWLEEGYAALAAPVRDSAGEVVAAMAVGGPAVRLTPERYDSVGQLVLTAAGRTSHLLGYRP